MKNSMEITLSELPLNSLGYISKINCNENIKRRLLDLGLIENSKIIPVLISPFGNSKAYDIRGTLISLRNDESNNIIVKYYF